MINTKIISNLPQHKNPARTIHFTSLVPSNGRHCTEDVGCHHPMVATLASMATITTSSGNRFGVLTHCFLMTIDVA